MLLASLVLGAVMGCGSEEARPPQEEELGGRAQSLADSNGLVINGLVINGLSPDALTSNALVINGLGAQGLASPDFINWFNQDPARSDLEMKYIVRCAVSAGQQRSFTLPSTGVTYTWDGLLGLTQHWADGQPATVVEQQLISACLMAHVNTYGVHVPLSLLGDTESGDPIYSDEAELAEYSTREACFFGNLFNGEGLYAGNDRNSLPPEKSTPRRCGLSQTLSGVDSQCSPITRVGSCEMLSCTMDPASNYYRKCTYNGIEYRVLTTRIHPSDVYTCGDGICQVGERCGTGTTADSCGLDCGPCP